MVPEIPGTTFKQAFETVAELSSLRKSQDPLIRRTISVAEKLEGITRHHGIHASAVIIAPSDIRELVPVMNVREKFLKKDEKKNDSSSDESNSTPLEDLLVTQFEGKLIEDAGLLKMDFLGLKTLSILKDALANIKTNHGVDIDLDQLPLDDKKTYELFQRAETIGIFQFESAGMRKYLRDLKPTDLEDLIAMNNIAKANLGDGFQVSAAWSEGKPQTLTLNRASSNDGYGIHVQGTTPDPGTVQAVISENIARENQVDLKDDNADCHTAIWQDNTFDTASETCIH